MKTFILLLLLSANVRGDILKLSPGDEAKLAELVSKLPLDIRTRRIEELSGPRKGVREKSVFPNIKGAFNIFCESIYYLNSTIPSASRCELNLDVLHPDVEENYEEYKLIATEPAIVKALHENISYGKPFKEFRSMDFRSGINFDGEMTYIFPYFFKCSETECILKFSK